MRMSMVRANENYEFSYRPGIHKRLDYKEMSSVREDDSTQVFNYNNRETRSISYIPKHIS